jgi:hypothetical protein
MDRLETVIDAAAIERLSVRTERVDDDHIGFCSLRGWQFEGYWDGSTFSGGRSARCMEALL